MLSVNTNMGAMVALQYLNQTQSQLNSVQNAINTGLKVASAKDDGATQQHGHGGGLADLPEGLDEVHAGRRVGPLVGHDLQGPRHRVDVLVLHTTG